MPVSIVGKWAMFETLFSHLHLLVVKGVWHKALLSPELSLSQVLFNIFIKANWSSNYQTSSDLLMIAPACRTAELPIMQLWAGHIVKVSFAKVMDTIVIVHKTRHGWINWSSDRQSAAVSSQPIRLSPQGYGHRLLPDRLWTVYWSIGMAENRAIRCESAAWKHNIEGKYQFHQSRSSEICAFSCVVWTFSKKVMMLL